MIEIDSLIFLSQKNGNYMDNSFGKLIKKLRTEKLMSQQQLADKAFVDRSSVANWERGRRIPDLVILSRIARALDVDVSVFTNTLDGSTDLPDIIIVDDEKIPLSGATAIIAQAIPNANITSFDKVSEAMEYASTHKIALAFLDIELGTTNGIDLCKKLLEINPLTNIIFLTSFPGYALDAWKTGASGFLTKPLHLEDVNDQLSKLRHPVNGIEK